MVLSTHDGVASLAGATPRASTKVLLMMEWGLLEKMCDVCRSILVATGLHSISVYVVLLGLNALYKQLMQNFKFMFKFSSTIFFPGLTAGGNYQHTGGGTNYQCLPLNPQFDGYSHSGGAYSWMCGTMTNTLASFCIGEE